VRNCDETPLRVRIQSSPPASPAFSLSQWRSARKLHFAAQNARISRGQTSNVCLKRTAGLAICSYFSEAGSGSGVSQTNLNHRFALTALRQSVLGFAFSLRGAEIWRVLSFRYWYPAQRFTREFWKGYSSLHHQPFTIGMCRARHVVRLYLPSRSRAGSKASSDLWLCPKCGGPMVVIERLTAAEIQLRSPPALVTEAA
jgi:hypothetical protein